MGFHEICIKRSLNECRTSGALNRIFFSFLSSWHSCREENYPESRFFLIATVLSFERCPQLIKQRAVPDLTIGLISLYFPLRKKFALATTPSRIPWGFLRFFCRTEGVSKYEMAKFAARFWELRIECRIDAYCPLYSRLWDRVLGPPRQGSIDILVIERLNSSRFKDRVSFDSA